jgi:hypothetical protein
VVQIQRKDEIGQPKNSGGCPSSPAFDGIPHPRCHGDIQNIAAKIAVQKSTVTSTNANKRLANCLCG